MTDDTIALQAQIDAVPAGDGFAFDRTYTCDGTITITKAIEVDFNGHELRALTDASHLPRLERRARAHLRVQGASDVTIRHPIITGAHPNGGTSVEAYVAEAEAQHGIDIVGGTRVLIEDATVTDVYGDFLYVGKGSSEVTVAGLYGRRNGRQGVAVTSAADVWMTGLDLDAVRRTMFDLEPNKSSERVERVLIEDCEVGEARLNFLSASSAAGHIGDITLRQIHSVMPFRSNIGNMLVANRGPFHLSDIVAEKRHGSPQACCLLIRNTQGVVVDGCTVPVQAGRSMTFVKTEGACGPSIIVSNNSFPDAVATVHPASGPVVAYGNAVGTLPLDNSVALPRQAVTA